MCGDQRSHAGDTRDDQHQIGDGTEDHHRQHVLVADALAEDEGVLRADGHDQAQAGDKPE